MRGLSFLIAKRATIFQFGMDLFGAICGECFSLSLTCDVVLGLQVGKGPGHLQGESTFFDDEGTVVGFCTSNDTLSMCTHVGAYVTTNTYSVHWSFTRKTCSLLHQVVHTHMVPSSGPFLAWFWFSESRVVHIHRGLYNNRET